PLTGQTQWVRHGVDVGCDLLGDDEMVIAAPPNSSNNRQAVVLRTTDGQLLGERFVPPMDKRWTNYGHRMLVFRDLGTANQAALALFDPWTQQDVWSEKFSGWNNGQAPAFKGTLIDGEAVAVLQTDGKFVLLNLADGKKIIDTQLAGEKDE